MLVLGSRLPWSAFPVGLPFPPRHAHLAAEATRRKDFVEMAKVLQVLRRAPHRPARRFIYGRQGRNLSSTGSHWQPLAATCTSHTSHTMCTIHHATTAIALFSFSCNMQRVTKLWPHEQRQSQYIQRRSEEFQQTEQICNKLGPLQDNSRAIANGERPLLAEVLLK